MESFEYKGVWWFPQFPDHQVAGILKFDPIEGAFLELLGDNFIGPIAEIFGVPDEPMIGAKLIPQNIILDVILGNTNKGDYVTLYKCAKRGENWATGYIGAVYRVQVVFIGCHFEKEEDIVFDTLSIRYSHLEQWLGVTGFSGGFKLSEEGDYIGGEVKYSIPEHIETRVNNFNVTFYHDFRFASDMIADVHMKQFTYIEITPDYPISYDRYHSDVIYHLRNFLSLGIGTAVLPMFVKGKNKNFVIERSNGGTQIRDISIYYVAKGTALNEQKHLERWDMLFRYQDLEDNFANYFQTWFTKAEILRTVCDQYFGIFYIPSMYLHLEFLTLAQAFETYHRQMYDGVYMPSDQYEPINQKISQSIPKELDSDHRKSLENRIKYGYQYSLRKRIKLILNEILAPYEKIVDRLVDNRTQFIKKLVDTRNYLTHYTTEPDQTPITDPNEQYIFVQKMKLLMQLCFFMELGLPIEVVEKLVKNNHKFQWSMRPL